MCGLNIQSPSDQLRKVQESYLFHSLVHPKPQMASLIGQLRTVYTLDLKRYSQLKRQLPYLVCGTFNPPIRISANFAYTDSFFLDLDHLATKQLNLENVRKEIASDPRVAMCFASPSKDGLKILFRFKERCYDKGLYSVFYKAFSANFARQHNLLQVVDVKTSDVTRACFISVDPEAYYNPEAEPVDLSTLVDTNNPVAVADLKHEQDVEEKRQKKLGDNDEPSKTKDPDKEIMAQIRSRLNPKGRPQKREVYVPERLEEIMTALKEYMRPL